MLTEIIEFVKKYPAVYDCDERLEKLKAQDTIRNEYEAYSKLNGSNVPTLTELMEYSEWVSIQHMQDLQNPLKINKSLKYALHDGTFDRIRVDADDEDHPKHIFSAPLLIRDIIRRDTEFLIEYQWLDAIDTKPVAEFLTFVNQSLKLSGNSKQAFAEFTFALISKALEEEIITKDPAPILVDDNGKIEVNFDTTGLDTKKNLILLRDFYNKASNQHAFVSAFATAVIAPLSFEIRRRTPSEFIMPIYLAMGQTDASKTSLLSIFVQNGYNQSKEMAVLSNEQVMTPFTFTKT